MTTTECREHVGHRIQDSASWDRWGSRPRPDLDVTATADPAKIISAIGVPSLDDVDNASQWLASLPAAIETAVRDRLVPVSCSPCCWIAARIFASPRSGGSMIEEGESTDTRQNGLRGS